MDAPLSLIIRTLDCEVVLAKVLSHLDLKPGDQLIVVDSGSRDGTLKVAAQFGAEILSIAQAEFTYSKALNCALPVLRHDWVLVLSSHSVPCGSDLLETYRRALPRLPANTAAAAGAVFHTSFDKHRLAGITLYTEREFHENRGFGAQGGNGNSLYRRDLLLKHPFSEAIITAEDMEWYLWALREGYGLAMVHGAGIRNETHRSLPVMYAKGEQEYRVNGQLWGIETPVVLHGVLIFWLKLAISSVLGKMGWGMALRRIAQSLGSCAEARRQKQLRF